MRGLLLTDEKALEPFVRQWDALSARSERPYCSPAWMLAWWRHAAPLNSELRVVVAADGERLLGVAPFFLERRGRVFRRLRILGAGTSSRVDLLSEMGREQDVGRVLWETLCSTRPRPHVVLFEGIDRRSPWPRIFRMHSSSRVGPTLRRVFSQPAPTATLKHSSFDDWFAGRSAKFRKNMRRARRHLADHNCRERILTEPEEVVRGLAAFISLHHSRWAGRGGTGVLTPRVERMLEDVCSNMSESGRVWISEIDLDGDPISSHMFLRAGGEIAYWLGGFDESWSTQQPAMVAVLAAVEHAYTTVSVNRLDLGSGAQEYKYRFADDEDILDWLSLLPVSAMYPVAWLQLTPVAVQLWVARRLSGKAKRRLRHLRGKLTSVTKRGA